jgi:hypothetical protein
MVSWTKSTAHVLRFAALVAVFASLSLSGCGGTSGSSSTGATSAAPAAAPDTASSDPIAFSADNVSVSQSAGSISLTVTRTGGAASAVSVDFDTADGTAVAGTDYDSSSGTLQWAENDSSPKTITVPISNAAPFSGVKSFQVVLTNPTGNGAQIGSPGGTTVSISGDATAEVGSIELSDDTYSVAQTTATMSVTVNRTGGATGAVSVAYSTSNGTAVSGTDYTATNGVLEWADGDATSKTFNVSISNATGFDGNKTFNVALSDARSGATLSAPSSAVVTIAGRGSAAAGTLQLAAASSSVSQSSGTLKISVMRVNGSSGAVSVTYATTNGTAVAGTDYTAAKGTLNWAAADTAAKTISVAISNGTAFSGAKNFKVALSNPSAKASVGSPGTATVTINGASTPAVGALELSKSSYSVVQGAGSVTITVNRIGGSSGAASISYATSNGTAVAGTDFTAASGTLKWADADAASKTVSIPISGSSLFSGTRSFSVKLSTPAGSTLGSPATASVAITGSAAAAIGSLQLSASAFAVAQSAGSVSMTVNRTGGTSGAISVHYATANGTAAAGTDYTATSGTLNWADGDAASKTISVPVSTASAFSGTKSFNLALSSPTAGATLSSPSSAAVTITGSGSPSSPASAGTFWVYHNGTFNWTADFSFLASINYKDTATAALSGPDVIGVSIVGAYGGFQPYALNGFDTSPYKYLIFSIKPTVANQIIGTGFDANNDVKDGNPLTIAGPGITQYGPAVPVVGQWNSYKIPLADFAFNNPDVLKFSIADGTGNPTNLFYVDNVGFTTQ